jgi:hypothetical protein
MARNSKNNQPDPLHGGTVHVPRTRGAVSGILLIALGAWGALIPFIGPWFDFSFSPDHSWHWTAARGWLEVLPGIAVALGGLMLLLTANRITASVGGWLAVAGGAWLVVGNNLADLFHIGSPGTPLGSSKELRALEALTFFDGLGALVLILASLALGRLSVRSVRDVRSAQRREVEAEAEKRRQDAYAESHRDQVAAGSGRDRDNVGAPPRPPLNDQPDTDPRAADPTGPHDEPGVPSNGATAWDRPADQRST